MQASILSLRSRKHENRFGTRTGRKLFMCKSVGLRATAAVTEHKEFHIISPDHFFWSLEITSSAVDAIQTPHSVRWNFRVRIAKTTRTPHAGCDAQQCQAHTGGRMCQCGGVCCHCSCCLWLNCYRIDQDVGCWLCDVGSRSGHVRRRSRNQTHRLQLVMRNVSCFAVPRCQPPMAKNKFF